MDNRYPTDVLAAAKINRKPAVRQVPADRGLVVEEPTSGWVGAVQRVENRAGIYVVDLEDRHGRVRTFPLATGFWVDGQPITLVQPKANRNPSALGGQPASALGNQTSAKRSASGSRVVPNLKAQVAAPSRIWVEGRHDAELIEKVWGHDLRVEGVVVEMLDGVDHLADRLAIFEPTMQRRVGVLVDHLVPGSKEQRLVAAALKTVPPGSVLALGHPYIDVWQAVKPARIGLKAWPVIDRGTEWKHGIIQQLGWAAPNTPITQADISDAWHRILATVRDYRDLEPSLLGRVEELIDFVTQSDLVA